MFKASPRQKEVRIRREDVRPGIGELDFTASGKILRIIRLGIPEAGTVDEEESGGDDETSDGAVRSGVPAVLEESDPSVLQKKSSRSAVSLKRSSSVGEGESDRGSALTKPCGRGAASSVEEDIATLPWVGVLGREMLSQSQSTSASCSSHTL